MIKDRETLETIFTIVKNVKKPIVAIYPDGRVIGTDEQFASMNELALEVDTFSIDIPYVFILKELSAFMRDIKDIKFNNDLLFDKYFICIRREPNVIVINHAELLSSFMDLYTKVVGIKTRPVIYNEENFQESNPEIISLKVSDGAINHFVGDIMMTSFNAIHPATKTDRIDLLIRDYDIYSYVSEFIIYKKKGNYQLHEFLRFRKV